MAKITPSSLVSEITGKFAGHVFQMWKGQIVIRAYTPPTQPRTQKQQLIRGIVNNLAGDWSDLSGAQQTNWDDYAAELPDVMSGFNSYIRNNTKLLYADHVSLTQITTPPDPPNPPTSPTDFTVTYDGGDDEFDLEWTAPNDASLWVQAFVSPRAAYKDKTSPMWNFIETVVSTALVINYDASDYTSPRYFRFRIRVIDAYGEVSAWTDTKIDSK